MLQYIKGRLLQKLRIKQLEKENTNGNKKKQINRFKT